MNVIKEILKGIIIGIANIIPGVSGGTMMVSMGIYDKIIGSVNRLFREFVKSVKTLFPYIIGMGVGIIGLSFIIEYLFGNFPLQTAMLFIGLIFGGIPVIVKKVKGRKPEPMGIVLFLVFFALIIGVQMLKSGTNVSMDLSFGLVVKLFAIGVLASATMVIPGVSGSMILMSLGYYNPIIEKINSFITAAFALDFKAAFSDAAVLVPFGIGIVLGIFAIAKIIEFLLKRFERLTYFSILGLIAASPIAVLMGIGLGTISVFAVLTAVVTFACGFAAAYFLSK